MSEFNPERIHVDSELLKDYITAEAVLRAYDSILQPKNNRNDKIVDIICPFHNDKNHGSCKVWMEKNDFYCYGCGKGGNVAMLAFHCVEIVHGGNLNYDRQCYYIAEDLGIDFALVTKEGNDGEFKKVEPAPDDALYESIFGKNYFAFNTEFKNIKLKFGEAFVPVEQEKVYFHTLFRQDRVKHDAIVLCYANAKFEDMIYGLDEEKIEELIRMWIAILKKLVKDIGDVETKWKQTAKKILMMKKIMGEG